MNTPHTEDAHENSSRTKLVVAGVAAVVAIALLIGIVVSVGGDDEPAADATGEPEAAGDGAPDPDLPEQPAQSDDNEDLQDSGASVDEPPQVFDLDDDDEDLDVLVGDPEVPGEPDNGEGETVVDDWVGLGQLCVDIRHQPVDDQNSASGIWVRGEVYGLDGGWIWVEGPTINNGDPVQIPVEGSQFEGGLGINSYGQHEIESFRLVGADNEEVLSDATDLLDAAFDGVIPVDADEGSAFDTDCFDFDQPSAESDEPDLRETVDEFLDGFINAHQERDADRLLDSLHPRIPEYFGAENCDGYVRETAGSVVGADIIDIGEPRPYELETPNGPLRFDAAIPVTVEFEVFDGTTLTNEANFPVEGSDVFWLTTCGPTAP